MASSDRVIRMASAGPVNDTTGMFGSVYGYSVFDEDQIPNYWHWARQNVLFDNFFASAQGPLSLGKRRFVSNLDV